MFGKRIKRNIWMFFICLQGYCTVSAQIKDELVFPFDTVSPNMLRGNVIAFLTMDYKEYYKNIDVSLLTIGKAGYILPKGTDLKASIHQWVERDDGGSWTRKSFLLLGGAINKYKYGPDGRYDIRKFYVQPVLIFQTNSDRGLNIRSEFGALIHPFSTNNKKRTVNLDLGVGLLASIEGWKIIDEDDIGDLSQDEQDRIRFVADNLPVNGKGNFHYTTVKGVFYATSLIRLSSNARLDITGEIQQGFTNPYNPDIRDQYPELKHIYPAVILDAALDVDITKTLSCNIVFRFDWEKSGLNLYLPKHETLLMVGVNWKFSHFSKIKN